MQELKKWIWITKGIIILREKLFIFSEIKNANGCIGR